MRVLYLSANPAWTQALEVNVELKKIMEVLQWGIRYGHSKFDFVPEVRRDEFERHVAVEQPNIVHFSGHGEKGKLLFSDHEHEIEEVSDEWLAQVLADKNVDVLFLSACWSASLNEKLRDVVGVCIGTTETLSDIEAANFSESFYTSLQSKLTIEQSFNIAANAGTKGLFEIAGNDANKAKVLIGDAGSAKPEVEPENLSASERMDRSVAKLEELDEKLKPGYKVDLSLIAWYVVVVLITWGLLSYISSSIGEATPIGKFLLLFKWEPWPVFVALAGPPVGRVVAYLWKLKAALPLIKRSAERYRLLTSDVHALALERFEKTITELEDHV